MATLDFELEISPGVAGSYPVVARAPGGEAAATLRWSVSPAELDHQLAVVKDKVLVSSAVVRRAPTIDEQPVRELGQRLFDAVIAEDVRALYVASRQHARENGSVLRLVLRVRPPELARLPWEFLFDASRQDYLGLTVPLVRYLQVLAPRAPLRVAGPLRILGMVARPGDQHALDGGEEQRRLQAALAGLQREGLMELEWVGGQMYSDLEDALDDGPWHVFHFVGHGGYDQVADEGTLALADETGRTQPVGADRPVDDSVMRARRALRVTNKDTLEWGTPVLYLRAPDGHIFDALIPPPSQPGPAVDPAPPSELAATPSTSDRQKLPVPPTPSPPIPARLFRHFALTRGGDSRRNAVYAVAFSPDGHRLATASGDRTARVWDASSGAELTRVTHDDMVQGVAFSPDGLRVATASSDKTARVWDATSGQELARVTHNDWVQGVAFSPDGHRLATASHDKTARVWDTSSGAELVRLTHDREVLGVVFSPDGRRLATASHDTTARVWDTSSGQELARVTHDASVHGVALTPDGHRLATASHDKTARVWDTSSWQELARVTHSNPLYGVAFSPDGHRLATASYGPVRVWDANSGQELARVTTHNGWVQGVAFSPDGHRLATASGDGTARIWVLSDDE